MDEPFRCLTELGDTALEALYATLRGEQGSWTLTDRAEWERVSTAVSDLTSTVLDERAQRSVDRKALGIYEPSRFPTAVSRSELPDSLDDNEKALIIAGNITGMGRQYVPESRRWEMALLAEQEQDRKRIQVGFRLLVVFTLLLGAAIMVQALWG